MVRGRSRYGTHRVMANFGFGDLTIYQDTYRIIITQAHITKQGRVYRSIDKLIQEKNYDLLRSMGIKVLETTQLVEA